MNRCYILDYCLITDFSKLGKGVDMSAIKGAEGEEYPIRIPKIVDICTSNMRFEYKKPVTHSNKNLAKLGEKLHRFTIF